MTPYKRFAGMAVAVVIAVTLALPGAADAKAGRVSYVKLYPRATQLCTEIKAGGGPAKLRPVRTQVETDCATLENGFKAVAHVVVAAEATIDSAQAADNASIRLACVGRPNHPFRCRRTEVRLDRVIQTLKHQRQMDIFAFWRAVETNRQVFWTSIRALGGTDVPEDAPIPLQSS